MPAPAAWNTVNHNFDGRAYQSCQRGERHHPQVVFALFCFVDVVGGTQGHAVGRRSLVKSQAPEAGARVHGLVVGSSGSSRRGRCSRQVPAMPGAPSSSLPDVSRANWPGARHFLPRWRHGWSWCSPGHLEVLLYRKLKSAESCRLLLAQADRSAGGAAAGVGSRTACGLGGGLAAAVAPE